MPYMRLIDSATGQETGSRYVWPLLSIADPDEERCSFCDRPKSAVRRMLAGQAPGSFVCDACLAAMREMLELEVFPNGAA